MTSPENPQSRWPCRFLFVAEAVVPFSVRREGYFSFRKGQKFDILEEKTLTRNGLEEELYFARDENGTVGFVQRRFFLRCEDERPILCGKSWYRGGVSKDEIMRILRDQSPGCYLVIDSPLRIGSFEIAVTMLGYVSFVEIVTHSSGYFILNKRFSSLVNIIEYYHKIPIAENQLLEHPLVHAEQLHRK